MFPKHKHIKFMQTEYFLSLQYLLHRVLFNYAYLSMIVSAFRCTKFRNYYCQDVGRVTKNEAPLMILMLLNRAINS